MYVNQLDFATSCTQGEILHTLEPMRANRIWRDNEGRVVLWQTPNIWILIWMFARLIGFLIGHGKLASAIHWVGSAALIVWALLEIFQGASYFRRALGVGVLLVTVASIFKIGL
jgi:hypothetical protein